jgi:predicted RNA binding protein YcfA (HicA-like mRNA interferase family)
VKSISGKEFYRILERNGWSLSRINGSHHIYLKAGSTARISVPVHGARALKRGLLLKLAKDAGVTKDLD